MSLGPQSPPLDIVSDIGNSNGNSNGNAEQPLAPVFDESPSPAVAPIANEP